MFAHLKLPGWIKWLIASLISIIIIAIGHILINNPKVLATLLVIILSGIGFSILTGFIYVALFVKTENDGGLY